MDFQTEFVEAAGFASPVSEKVPNVRIFLNGFHLFVFHFLYILLSDSSCIRGEKMPLFLYVKRRQLLGQMSTTGEQSCQR